MTFLTILAVTEILRSFRLVLEGTTGKEIHEPSRLVHRKVSNKQFCFIRCKRQYLRAVEKRRYSRFTFVEVFLSLSPNIDSSLVVQFFRMASGVPSFAGLFLHSNKVENCSFLIHELA